MLPTALPPLRFHATQRALWDTTARFVVVPAGRRSGKTLFSLLHLKRMALRTPCGWLVFAAPTQDQAKRIAWSDRINLRNIFSAEDIDRIYESSPPTIRLVNGCEITVLGMDKPQRIEGRGLDGIIIDEFGSCRPSLWGENVRPALSTPGRPPGWAWLIGVPEGRNHYWELYRQALSDQTGDWAAFTWPSADIVDPSEVEAARRDLDPLTFEQEYLASFVSFVGRAYYPFSIETHCTPLEYWPNAPLCLAFDFNRSPGVCAYIQEQHRPGPTEEQSFTAVIGEVWIPRDSNTPRVCARIIADWSDVHNGPVRIYGDSTGGAGGTAKVLGTDWDLIGSHLRPAFGDRLERHVPRANPRQRDRVNAVNSRLRTSAGEIRLLVDPSKAPRMVDDLEGVRVLEGGTGEIDKTADPALTHLSDALGYYVAQEHPIRANVILDEHI